jgi:outer membrane receptor for ferric coprogen and ferric-rhodotorulic acid
MPTTRRPAPSRSPLRDATLLMLGTALAITAAAQTTGAEGVPPAKDGAQEPVVLDAIKVTGSRTDSYVAKDSASATKLTLSPRETPQSMTVITRERLEDQGLTSLREVLDNTPGVYSNAYDSERVLFYSRGFLIDTLMYDGVPALSNFNTGSIDETLETALYERIEVVRGATGLMTGAGNPAASINLVRKHADSRTATFGLDLTAGSWQTRRAEADATVPLNADGSIRARAVAVGEDRDSYQALYNKRTYVLYGIVDADLTPATRLSLGFDHQDNRPRSNTWGSFPLYLADGRLADWPRSVTTATDWSYWNRKTQTVFGELRHAFDNGWTLRSTLSHRRYSEEQQLFYVFGYPDPTTGTGLEPYAYRSRGKITEKSLDVYASGPFEFLDRKHELVVGYNGSRARNIGTVFEPLGTLPDPGNFFEWDGSYPEPAFAEGTPLNDIRTDQDGLYAAGRFSLADSLKLIAGARFARWKIDSFYLYDTPVDTKYNYSKTIPYAGLVWDILPQYSAFASYTGIFKPQNNRNANGHYLDPMEGRSFEVGLKGEHLDRRLNTAITLFETRQNNVAAPVIDPGTGDPELLPDGGAVSQPIKANTRGFEIEAAGRLTSELQGSFGWTRYLTQNGSGQAVRTFIPSTLVRLFATWEPRRLVDHLSLGAGVNWQSASSTVVGSPSGPAVLRQGSVAQVSLMARYQFSPNVSAQFNADNLLDKKYYVLDEYDNTYYGAPANYSVTVRLSY